MQKKAKVSLGFLRLTQDEFPIFTDEVIFKTDGKEAYAPCQKEITATQKANNDFKAALVAAKDGGKTNTRLKDEAFTTVKDAEQRLAEMIGFIANGDKDYILNAGFELQKDPSEVTELDMPTNCRAVPPKIHGKIQFVWDAVEGATGYMVRVKIGDATEFDLPRFNSACKATLENLIPGQKAFLTVCAVGTHGLQSTWTVPIETVVW
jgi:hypothetical protein